MLRHTAIHLRLADDSDIELSIIAHFLINSEQICGLMQQAFGIAQKTGKHRRTFKVTEDPVDTTGMNGTHFQFDALGKMLDASAMRHRAIGSNIANVNTPGYQRQDVDFQSQLADAIDQKSLHKLADLDPKIIQVGDPAQREDGNNVDIDSEIGALGKNSLHFETYAQILASKIGMMQSAISGRP